MSPLGLLMILGPLENPLETRNFPVTDLWPGAPGLCRHSCYPPDWSWSGGGRWRRWRWPPGWGSLSPSPGSRRESCEGQRRESSGRGPACRPERCWTQPGYKIAMNLSFHIPRLNIRRLNVLAFSWKEFL